MLETSDFDEYINSKIWEIKEQFETFPERSSLGTITLLLDMVKHNHDRFLVHLTTLLNRAKRTGLIREDTARLILTSFLNFEIEDDNLLLGMLYSIQEIILELTRDNVIPTTNKAFYNLEVMEA